MHDHSLFFDEDGRVYLVNGSGDIWLTELTEEATAIKLGGVNQVIITNASAVAGPNVGLIAEGSQLRKVNGKYYLFNITWPRGGMRTVIVHRADKLTGPYEGRVALMDKGMAQGGLIDTPQGDWFAYLFKNRTDKARLFYSLDGKSWNPIGSQLNMAYTLPHFMGYRFGLFNFATKTPGGYADFDYFHVGDRMQVTHMQNQGS